MKKEKIAKGLIQLKRSGRLRNDISKFRENVLRSIGDEIFKFQTKQILLFNVLKQISPLNKEVQLNDESIENACKKIVYHFGLYREAKIVAISTSSIGKIKEKEKLDNTTKFCRFIMQLNIDKLPYDIFNQLSTEINKDLLRISQLIKWYETKIPILKYIKRNEVPKGEERVIYDFYKRCIDQRVEILDYLLFGLKERVLVKTRYTGPFYESVTAAYDVFFDRPYRFAQPYQVSYFDYKKINKVGHRIGEFSVREADEMEELYITDKSLFYKKYFKKHTVEQHFKNISFYLPYLPLKDNREIIFEELIRLFKTRRWISFYALALPQVEGLFSEMCETIDPEMNINQKGLSFKVNAVRPFHQFGEEYFDYFQYHLPSLRNKFAHTGYEQEFKLKSFDLLVDLAFLLKVYSELDNPFVKIKNLLREKNAMKFISADQIAEYLKLLTDLKTTQLNKIKTEIENFEKTFLIEECEISHTCLGIIEDLPIKLNEFINYINEAFWQRNKKIIKFEQIKHLQIKELFSVPEQLETMKNCFIVKRNYIDLFEDYFMVISNHKIFLPSLSKDVQGLLNQLYSKYKDVLKSIQMIKLEVKG